MQEGNWDTEGAGKAADAQLAVGCPQVWHAAGCEPGEAAAALMAAGQRAASALAPGGQNRGARMAWQEFRKVVRVLLASLADCQPGEPPTVHMYGHHF